MPVVWISAQFVNPPKKNPKFGSIKDPTLGYIDVPVAVLDQFQKGKRYLIEYEDKANGYKNFIRFANPPQSTQGNFDGRNPDHVRPPVKAPLDRRVSQATPLPVDTQPMHIFVTGLVGRALGSGHFSAADVDNLTKAAKDSFLKHLAPQPVRQTSAPEPEFNDPLPDPNQYGAQQPDDEIPY